MRGLADRPLGRGQVDDRECSSSAGSTSWAATPTCSTATTFGNGLNKDLGFTEADRVENIRRVAEVSKLMVDAGLIVITSFISPFDSERRMARELLEQGEFIEVFVDAPLAVAEARDPKQLYARARRGEIKNFTGIDSPYERPEVPELHIDTTQLTPEQAAELIVEELRGRGILGSI